MHAIELQNLRKEYGVLCAVEDLTFTVAQGELFSLLGVNGAGKTTTIKMLCGLCRPSGGDAFLLGKSIVSDTAAAQELIGVSPQQTAVAPALRAEENLSLMCRLHGFSAEKTKQRIAALCAQLSLGEVLRRPAGKLSGGWQRRLSIAMALITEPKILFLDEPTLGLDVIARSELWDVIRALKGQTTIVLTTHYLEEAQALSDHVGIMRQGRLLALGTPRELTEKTGRERFEDAFVSIVKGEGK